MQIVKIFPNNKNKCHFSIRKHQNKFFVFEGDKMLRTELDNINSAETEISLIVLARKNRGVTEIPVTYQEGVIVNVLSEEMPENPKCKNCGKEFSQSRSNRKQYCSKECSTQFNNRKRNNFTPKTMKEDKKCVVCNTQFTPSRSNHVCCSQKCSTINFKRKQSAKNNVEERDGFEKGIRDAYAERVPEFVDNFVPQPNSGIVDPIGEVLNEFHELTEREMRLSLRRKKVGEFSTDIVAYVVTWCELNEDKPFSYHTLFNDLINYKIVDLSKGVFINVFSPVLSYEAGILRVSGNFSDSENLLKITNKLSETIFEENAIPTEEQYTKVAVLRLMTSQLRFFLYERKQIKKTEPEVVSSGFDGAIFQGVLDMLQNLSNQNTLLGEILTKSLEENKKLVQVQFENTMSTNRDIHDLKNVLDSIREKVAEITKKRKGFWG